MKFQIQMSVEKRFMYKKANKLAADIAQIRMIQH